MLSWTRSFGVRIAHSQSKTGDDRPGASLVGIRFRSRCRRRKDLTSCRYSIEGSLTSVMSDPSVMNGNGNIKLKSHAVRLRVNCRKQY